LAGEASIQQNQAPREGKFIPFPAALNPFSDRWFRATGNRLTGGVACTPGAIVFMSLPGGDLLAAIPLPLGWQ
jgi:hypothetical protein